jgi:bifunctional UDP-N-acetylglucosamine pyrophosphorylase / glucosamine-1-phosphate N-acetyltransferase
MTASVGLFTIPAVTSTQQRFAIAIMAAGKGTRLKSQHPKVLHEIAGRPLLAHVIAAATKVVPAADVIVIIGHEAERVRGAVQSTGVSFVVQAEQRGTGHAIMQCRDPLKDFDHVLVLSGDVPLIRPETVTRVRDAHITSSAAMTLLSAEPADPHGYGRVFRKQRNGRELDEVERIVEQKQLAPDQLALREINSGIYAFAVKPLFANIDKLTTDNPHHEFYLTDMAAVLSQQDQKVSVIRAPEASEVLGVNTRVELAELDSLLRNRKTRDLMLSGVTIFRPETCVIDSDVEVGADTIIEPFVHLTGTTKVGSDCRISSFSVIADTTIGDNVTLRPGCVMESSKVERGAIIGPYSHLRPGSDIGENAHVGNFVETKKTRLGKGSKANHLTYLGDSEIGAGVNIGAGTITCNYDGSHKYKTVIEDTSFIGSDSTLVAPVKIGRGSYIAAASCITEDVPADALAIGRGRQVNKQGWAKARKESLAKTKP